MNTSDQNNRDIFDVAIVGAGVSGSFIAMELTKAGRSCVMIEAGIHYDRHSYPRHEGEANARLFWSGGVELNTDANLALLRPKVVGGGSIVNQALIDRFEDDAWQSWEEKTGISWCRPDTMEPFYQKASKELVVQKVPETSWNENVRLFQRGFDSCGFKWAPLKRAQDDCAYEQGTDCIECLSGCRRDSKQSMPVTTLRKAIAAGLVLWDRTEVTGIYESGEYISMQMETPHGRKSIEVKQLVLAAGAIGNSALLLKSGYKTSLPALGEGFYTHPQEMVFGLYDRKIDAFKGGFQALKSDDPEFRRQGFKLENIFAPPASLAMLFSGWGDKHRRLMRNIPYFGCLEVAVRDTNPGRITVDRRGKPLVEKVLNKEDHDRRKRGLNAIEKILMSTGASDIIYGEFMIGLHLMGGCSLGSDRSKSVVGPDFRLHGSKKIFIADSSVFPDAPGINPSFTIMAMSLRASESILSEAQGG